MSEPQDSLPPDLAELDAGSQAIVEQEARYTAEKKRLEEELFSPLADLKPIWRDATAALDRALEPLFMEATADPEAIAVALKAIATAIARHDDIPDVRRRADREQAGWPPARLTDRLARLVGGAGALGDGHDAITAARLLRGAKDATTKQLAERIRPLLADDRRRAFGWLPRLVGYLDHWSNYGFNPPPPDMRVPNPWGENGWVPRYDMGVDREVRRLLTDLCPELVCPALTPQESPVAAEPEGARPRDEIRDAERDESDVPTLPAGEVPAHLQLPAMLSAEQIAELVGKGIGAVRQKLYRLAQDFPDCRIENEGRRRGEDKYIYRTADTLPHFGINTFSIR